jgi:hypothetical protein
MCFRLVSRFTLRCVWKSGLRTRFATISGSLRCSTNKRVAPFFYYRKGHSLRCISRLLSLSRDSVRKVAKAGSDEPPIILRPRKLDAHREGIAQMLAEFDGNVVKVHWALADVGTSVRYSTLTAFCRNNHLLDSCASPKRRTSAK